MFRRNEINQKQVPNVLDFCVAQFREAIILKKVANMGLGGGGWEVFWSISYISFRHFEAQNYPFMMMWTHSFLRAISFGSSFPHIAQKLGGSLEIYTCTVLYSSSFCSERSGVNKWGLVEHRFMMFFSQNCCNIISSQVCWRTSDTFGFHSTLHLDWSHELEYP